MQFIVKLFPEISIKSRNVRQRWTRQLGNNIRKQLRPLCERGLEVVPQWDRILVKAPGEEEHQATEFADVLARTPGIANFTRVQAWPLDTLEAAGELAAELYGDNVKGKTFSVRVKRSGKHEFTSTEAERIIGGVVKARTDNLGVRLNNPDVELNAEIKDDKLFLVNQRWEGLGGFPIGTQESVLTLLSGGFDSTVASYLMMRRGVTNHFCFFNLGGHEHEIGVKEIAYYLWRKFGSTQKVKFVSVPFEGVVAEILQNVDNSQMGVVLKRMMLRAASKIAEDVDASALVTGEAIGQVSSQTLKNLQCINSVTDSLVLRPLIVSDKTEIIDITRKIGAEEFAAAMPEYCAVISKKPTTRAKPEKIAAEEDKFDFSKLDDAVENAAIMSIVDIQFDKAGERATDVELVTTPGNGDIVLDIRHSNEQELHPFDLSSLPAGVTIQSQPFYQLSTAFAELDKSNRYLLWCDRGVMSRLHASHLLDEGYENVAVYRPESAN